LACIQFAASHRLARVAVIHLPRLIAGLILDQTGAFKDFQGPPHPQRSAAKNPSLGSGNMSGC
jgi:hypothetical protein